MIRVFAHQHNGRGAMVARANDGRIHIYRLPKTIGNIDGPVDADGMVIALRDGRPFQGNVNHDYMRALEGAMQQLVEDLTTNIYRKNP